MEGNSHSALSWNSLFQRTTSTTKTTCLKSFTLSYTDGVALVPRDIIDEGIEEWKDVLVGYFMDKRLAFPYVKRFLQKVWKLKGTMDITTDRDLFFINFSVDEDKQMALEGGPLFIAVKIFVIRPWSVEVEVLQNKTQTVPIWVKLSNVPMELWPLNGLSFLASLVVGPQCMDDATAKKERLSFAKACVTIPSSFKYPSSVPVDVGNRVVNIGLEYPWKPPACSKCNRFGHITKVLAPNMRVDTQAIVQAQENSPAVPIQNASHLEINNRNLVGAVRTHVRAIEASVGRVTEGFSTPIANTTATRHFYDGRSESVAPVNVQGSGPQLRTKGPSGSSHPMTNNNGVVNTPFSGNQTLQDQSGGEWISVRRGGSQSNQTSGMGGISIPSPVTRTNNFQAQHKTPAASTSGTRVASTSALDVGQLEENTPVSRINVNSSVNRENESQHFAVEKNTFELLASIEDEGIFNSDLNVQMETNSINGSFFSIPATGSS
ncbi:hypothetical protein IFM89_004957 [Coptis chinensis]|uniref:DUF4283 domain-containing protein n=1 Tax=Coptis chinensis TaxID=261450 RepID=A0A835HSY1_9MAGN|nr:hypothetical protein IFM89_004957 [Coptis chinensis]